MLLEIAIGDAYGMAFEYTKRPFVEKYNTFPATGYYKHPKHNIAPGCYTDDTQLSLALAEAMLVDNFKYNFLAQKFVDVFKRDPRTGYSRGMYAALCKAKNGQHLLNLIDGDSDRSGAAMRTVPIGLCRTIPEVMAKSAIQSIITHNTEGGVYSAWAVSLAAHYFYRDLGPKDCLGKFIESYVPGEWAKYWNEPAIQKGVNCVRAALTAVFVSNTLSEVLYNSIAFTGDVDTVAAMAMGIASLSYEIKKDIPKVLFDNLENGPFGRDYLTALDKYLFKKWN